MVRLKQLKTLGVILCVVLVGVGAFDLGFYFLFEEDLKLSNCELCFKLNPDYSDCEYYTPINYSNLNLVIVPYGE